MVRGLLVRAMGWRRISSRAAPLPAPQGGRRKEHHQPLAAGDDLGDAAFHATGGKPQSEQAEITKLYPTANRACR